jgi:hypothetical protein
MTVFLIKTIEIKPLPGSVLHDEHPEVKGAFVDIVVPADDEKDAVKKAVEFLAEDKYQVIKYEQICEFNNFIFDDQELEIEYKALARDALSKGDISYGPFFTWINNNEK